MINTFYALLFLVSGGVSLFVAHIAWNRRPMAGAIPLSLVMLSMVVWAWASAAYWLTPALNVKLFWLKIVFVGMVVSSPAFVVMVVAFTGHSAWLKPRFYMVLFTLPIVALFLLWTDDWFGLSFDGKDIWQLENTLRGGIGFRLAVVNGYLDTIFGIGLLIREFFRQTSLRRSQIGAVLIGSVFPMVPNIVSLANASLFHGLDVTPIAFSISGLFYIFGLLRFGMMDLAPMGRTAVFEKIEDGVLVIDSYGRVIDLNPMARSFIDEDIGDPIGRPMVEVFAAWMKHTGLNHQEQSGIHRVDVEGPDFYHYDISITPLVNNSGEILGRTFIWRDISKQKKTEIELREVNLQLNRQLEEIKSLHAQLREYSIRDSLTGVFNRGYMEETLDRELSRATREKVPLSVVMIDVDKFKMVNDTYGHPAGDTVLRTLGGLLMKNIRSGDVACRYGGDEMLVVMPDAPVEDAVRRANELGRLFSEIVFDFENSAFQTALSLGVASFPTHANTVDELLRVADQALYSVKNKHKP